MFCLRSRSTACNVAISLSYVVLLDGKLPLIESELLYAAPYEGKIDC